MEHGTRRRTDGAAIGVAGVEAETGEEADTDAGAEADAGADTETGEGAGPSVDAGAVPQEPVFQALGADDPRLLGGYAVVARLGAGGMGKVYLSHTPAGRPVALKVIRPELADDREFRRRFRQEVAAAQRVQGLYTAPVIDSDTDGTPAWLATAFVPGPTLAAAVARHGVLPVPAVLLLAAGMAEALQGVHGAGIVHRDLKPSNVLLAKDGPRVIDFGIAQAADATSVTNTGVFVGTPSFMSPEQATGSGLGPATDVFSLGQVVAFAAQGRPAFGEGQAHGVLYRIVHEEPDLSGVPEALLPLLERCLTKAPAGRPSPAEVIEVCRAASEDGTLARAENWLSEAVAADAGRHEAVPAQAPEPTARERLRAAAGRALGAVRGDGTAAVGAGALAAPASTATGGRAGAGGPTEVMRRRRLIPRRRGPRAALLACLGVLVLSVVWATLPGSTGAGGPVLGTDDGTTGGPSPLPSGDYDVHPQELVYKNIEIHDQHYLNFKDKPLKEVSKPSPDSSSIEVDCSADETEGDRTCVVEGYGTKFFPLKKANTGSLATCRELSTYSSAEGSVEPRWLHQICVTTSGGTMALFTYKAQHYDGSDFDSPADSLTLDVDIWYHAFPKKSFW
jgi:tRNA A-37 threonylcarbamoyl transferase component Bud32